MSDIPNPKIQVHIQDSKSANLNMHIFKSHYHGEIDFECQTTYDDMISDTGHKSYAVIMLSCHFWSLTGPGYNLFLL